MTLRRLLPFGLIALALLSSSGVAEGKTLYERLRASVAEDAGAAEDDVRMARFIRAVFANTGISEDDALAIVRGDGASVCAAAQTDERLSNIVDCNALLTRALALARDESHIRALGRSLQATASSYELPVADLPGRALELAADLRGIVTMWSAGTGSVKSSIDAPLMRTVTADSNAFRDPLRAIGEELKALDEEQLIAAVWRYQYGLRLIRGERAPRFPAPHIDAQSGVGSERQFLSKRWPELEAALTGVWNEAADDAFDPALTSEEFVAYAFDDALLEELLPDNVIVWVRIDGESGRPFSDVGLQWKTPIDPVTPSLVRDGDPLAAIRGGDWPPEPIVMQNDARTPLDGEGLCTSPTGERGYLCRAFEPIAQTDRCPIDPDAPLDAVQLIHCEQSPDRPEGVWCCNQESNQCSPSATSTQCVSGGGSPSADALGCAANGCAVPAENPVFCCLRDSDKMCVKTLNQALCVERGGAPSADANGCTLNGCNAYVPPPSRTTAAGADVCREIVWRNEPFDPAKNCKVLLQCEPDCSAPGDVSAETSPKDSSGAIRICAAEESQDISMTYLLFHEMTHAYRLCTKPADERTFENIPDDASPEERSRLLERNGAAYCQIEGEAYRAMCDMMERDGVFARPDGSPMISGEGVQFDAESCAEAWTHFTAVKEGYRGCFISRTYSAAFMEELTELSARNPKNLPTSCAAATDPLTMDPRLKQFKETVESLDDVCKPGEINMYKNRIGNNACYVGQCVELSTELRRIAAMSAPFGVQAPIAPWDDPQSGTPLGDVLLNPPLAQTRLPAYAPERFMREFEAALCALQGLPPLTPPVLCATDATRGLELTRVIGAEIATDLSTEKNESTVTALDLLELAEGVGRRAGTEMYARLMRESAGSFAGVLDMANVLLEDVKTIDFPTVMCPLSPGLPPPVNPAR